MAPVVRSLRSGVRPFDVEITAVQQHGPLLDEALVEWNLHDAYRIPVSNRGTLAGAFTSIVDGVQPRLTARRPDLVLVQGDTTTAFAAAVAASYQEIRVGHVEAGLRTGLDGPFPEEMHRRLIDSLSWVLYAPTERARRNLIREGILEDAIVVVGNTGVDAMTAAGFAHRTTLRNSCLVVVTVHRRENFGGGIEQVCIAVRRLVEEVPRLDVVYVLHANPLAREPAILGLTGIPRVRLVEPMPHQAFLNLLADAQVVITDSGGIQEETAALGCAVVVVRESTERQEVTESGLGRLVGANAELIVSCVMGALEAPTVEVDVLSGPYGDGRAAERIRADLGRRFAR